MSGNSTLPPPLSLPNPYTTLAWLPPAEAMQFEATQFVAVAILGIYAWDWLLSLPIEFKMVFGHKWSLATTLYMLSRIGTICYLTSGAMFVVAPIKHCNPVVKFQALCYLLSVPPTAGLFFLRVRAVYRENQLVVAFFFVIWLAVLGTSFLVPIKAGEAVHIGTTNICVETSISDFDSVPVIANMVLNVLVCLFISWRLGGDGPMAERSSLLTLFRTKGLSPVADSLIQSGQLYYLVTLGSNITMAVLFLTPSVSPAVRGMMTFPNLALENSMATRVFRMVRFNVQSPTPFSSARSPRAQEPYSSVVFRSGANAGVEVNVMTDMHTTHDDSVKRPEYAV